ncbi:MAG: hypothetical protein QF775_02210 [archaeon]|nr:hypothetical protein [Euryarchaeota archaeon]MDP6704278.1 hypothetical protein [archaeon]HIK01263.1 hypothetical protein [Candidatus Undinarchaeales archaeon ERR594346 U_76725]|tara:strand:- start:26471 stop:26839 length:369 start_codon:yes stop_codon:yes gene_type:complete
MSSKKSVSINDLHLLQLDSRLAEINALVAPVFTRTSNREYILDDEKMKLILLIDNWRKQNRELLSSSVGDSEIRVEDFLKGVSEVVNNLPSMDSKTHSQWVTLLSKDKRRRSQRNRRKSKSR